MKSVTMRWGAVACLFLLGGCAQNLAKTELVPLCQSEVPFRIALQKGNFADERVAERFSPVCRRLNRIEGLKFKDAEQVYLCNATVWRNPEDARVADQVTRQDAAFGRKLRIEDFDRSAGEPDDIRERMNRQRQQQNLTRLALGGSAGFSGVFGKFLLLTDEGGNLRKVLYTYEDFDRSIQDVLSLNGAMFLLELKNMAGFGGAKDEQCKIASIVAESGGWMIEEMPVQRNCAKPVKRDVRVGRDGSVQLIRQYEKFALYETVSMVCAD